MRRLFDLSIVGLALAGLVTANDEQRAPWLAVVMLALTRFGERKEAGPVVVYGDSFADETPRARQIRAQQAVAKAMSN